jgi:hypothetical protein
MISARRGEVLDFSKIHPVTPDPRIRMCHLPKKKLCKAREAVKSLAVKYKEARAKLPIQSTPDVEFEEWLRSLEGEELETGLTGTAVLADDLEDEFKPPNKG